MKVAYLVNQYPRNTHSFIRREIRELERLGVEVLRFSQRPCRERLASEEDRRELERTRIVLDAGVGGHVAAVTEQWVRHPVRAWRALVEAVRLGWRSDRGLVRHLLYLAEASVLARWLEHEPVDHLHAHFGTNSATVALLCHELGGPAFSFTVHGPDEFDRPELIRLGEKVRRSAFTVAISDFGRSQLYRWARPEDWRKVEVVRCGVDEHMLEHPRTDVPDVSTLLCVGRLGEQKGHLLLVEAAAELASTGLDFRILLAGDGPMRPAIEELVRRRGLQDRVHLAGWLSATDVRDAILGSRALVLASFAEGLPVVLMEALALARPVVATSIAGIPELVEPGVNGWIVPAGSAEALAGALRLVLETPPDVLSAMGRAGAERVAARHDASREAARLRALFAAAPGSRVACVPTAARVAIAAPAKREEP